MSLPLARKLGKQAPFHDPRTLQLANYLKVGALPPTPPVWKNYAEKVTNWPMFSNDTLGDCTCAGAGHMIMEWTANAGDPYVPTDAEIVAAYSAITGYTPSNPNSDQGAVETDVLKYWQSTGIAGHKIGAFVALQPGDQNHIKDAIALFTGCYIGVSLPLTAQGQTTWSVPPGGAVGQGAPGSWGGHAINIIGFNPRELVFISWGAVYRMTWEFWAIYCDEAYAIISPDLFNGKNAAPDGLDLAQLTIDLALVKN